MRVMLAKSAIKKSSSWFIVDARATLLFLKVSIMLYLCYIQESLIHLLE